MNFAMENATPLLQISATLVFDLLTMSAVYFLWLTA